MDPLSSSTSSSSSINSNHEQFNPAISGEGEQSKSLVTSLTEKLVALTLKPQPSSSSVAEKERKVSVPQASSNSDNVDSGISMSGVHSREASRYETIKNWMMYCLDFTLMPLGVSRGVSRGVSNSAPTEEKAAEVKERNVTGSKTPRDLVEEKYTPRKRPTSPISHEEEDSPKLLVDEAAQTKSRQSKEQIEDRRKIFSGSKTPPKTPKPALPKIFPQKGVADLQDSALENYHDLLTNEIDRQEGDGGSPATPKTAQLTPRSIVAAQLKWVENERDKRRDEAFLNKIENPENVTLRVKVSDYGDSVLRPGPLFNLIHGRIRERLENNTLEDIDAVGQLLIFCIDWLHDNKKTPKDLNAAAGPLTAIIQETQIQEAQNSSEEYIKSQSDVLGKKLSAALAKPDWEKITVSAGYFGGKSHFSSELEKIAKGTYKNPDKLAKKIAADLFKMQVGLFSAIEGKDLLLKHGKFGEEPGPAVTKLFTVDSVLTEFILNSIADASELSGVRNLMMFFLNVGEYSLDKYENHQGAACIFRTFAGTEYNIIKDEIQDIYKDIRYKKLKELFNGDREFEAYSERRENCEASNKLYIPYVIFCLNALNKKLALKPSVVNEPHKVPQYNIAKIYDVEQTTANFLQVQKRLGTDSKDYHSDFVKNDILAAHPYTVEETERRQEKRKAKLRELSNKKQ